MSIDLNAFNKFFIDYQQRFVHFACTYVHDEAVAEDFVVESMMYYWENKDRLSADTNIPAYVLTTIKHKCIDYLRHQQVYQDAVHYFLMLVYYWIKLLLLFKAGKLWRNIFFVWWITIVVGGIKFEVAFICF